MSTGTGSTLKTLPAPEFRKNEARELVAVEYRQDASLPYGAEYVERPLGIEHRYLAGLHSLLDRPDPRMEIKAVVDDGDGYVVVATLGNSREAFAAHASWSTGPRERWLGHLTSLAGNCEICGIDDQATDLWAVTLAEHSGQGFASDYRSLCETHLPCPPQGTLPAGQLAGMGLHAEEVVTLPPRFARAEISFRMYHAHTGSGRLMIRQLCRDRCRLTVASRNGPEVTRWYLRGEDTFKLIEKVILPQLAWWWLTTPVTTAGAGAADPREEADPYEALGFSTMGPAPLALQPGQITF